MAKKKIKRRKISKEILDKRKEFEDQNKSSVIVSPFMLNKKMPEKEKQKEYVESLIKDFDEMLKV